MIQTSTFNLIVAIGILLSIYSFIDHKNSLYANIPSAFIAGITFAFAGSAISTGIVSPDASASVGYWLYLVSTVMFAYTLFMAYEVINELFEQKDLAKKKMMEGENENL